MKKTAAVLCCCLWALGCGESTDANDPPSTLDIVDDYLEDLKPLLQGLRALDEDIARAVPGDSVSSDVIVPLIEARFRPKLIEFAAQVQDPAPAPELTTVHKHLQDYLRLRIEAFDLAIQGARQGQPELFEQFAERLASADEAARGLRTALEEVRHGMSIF